mmetsp:Transcript_16859/g.32301  ORF Transcript_16859/g.32301 Transcript_16859/m.32301 type:complete len:327 (+) Transcript_16859:498-1478(+)
MFSMSSWSWSMHLDSGLVVWQSIWMDSRRRWISSFFTVSAPFLRPRPRMMPVSFSSRCSSSCIWPLLSSSFVSRMSRTSLPSLPFVVKLSVPPLSLCTTSCSSSSSSSPSSPSAMMPRTGAEGPVGGLPAAPGGAMPPESFSLGVSLTTGLGGPRRADCGRCGAPPAARTTSCRSGSGSGSGAGLGGGFSALGASLRDERRSFLGLSSALGSSLGGSSLGVEDFDIPILEGGIGVSGSGSLAGSGASEVGGCGGGASDSATPPSVWCSPASTLCTASAASVLLAISPSIWRNWLVSSGSCPATTLRGLAGTKLPDAIPTTSMILVR